jgi:hypothetical protein
MLFNYACPVAEATHTHTQREENSRVYPYEDIF